MVFIGIREKIARVLSLVVFPEKGRSRLLWSFPEIGRFPLAVLSGGDYSCGMVKKDIFNPVAETREERNRRLELITIARMLCTRPNERRAVRLNIPESVYLIETRKTCDPLAIVGFQLISREYSPEKDAPAFLALINLIRSIAEKHNIPPVYLCAWNESHWGFVKIPAPETLKTPPESDSIVLFPQNNFLAIYKTNREQSTKITP